MAPISTYRDLRKVFLKPKIQWAVCTIWGAIGLFFVLFPMHNSPNFPDWLGFLSIPFFGVPAGFFYLLEVKVGKSKLSMKTYASSVLLWGPLVSLFWGALFVGAIGLAINFFL